jgi:hypothetical protein
MSDNIQYFCYTCGTWDNFCKCKLQRRVKELEEQLCRRVKELEVKE